MVEDILNLKILKGKGALIRDLKWQIIEKALRFLTTICVSLLISTFLGSEDFGKYTYTVSILSIWIGASNLGMSNLIVAQISKYKLNQEKIISTFLKIRIISTTLIFLIFLIYTLFNFKLGLYLVITVIFSFLDVFEFYNQGKLQLILNSQAKIIAYIFGFIFKTISILYFKSIELALVIYSIEFFFAYLLIYKFSKLNIFEMLFVKVDQKLLRVTLKKMIALSLTPFLTILTTKLDILIIKYKFGFSVLGEYNILSQVIMLWSIFPVMLTNYHLPRLANIYSSSIEHYPRALKRYGKIYFLVGLFLTFISLIVLNLQYYILNYQNNSIYWACTFLCFINIPTSISLLQIQIIAINNLQVYQLIKVCVYFISMTLFSLFLINFIGIIALPLSINFSLVLSEFLLPKFFKNSINYIIP
tara:strand:- start:54 stop:1304 length:1251 start_codon:yes stop_codon:yes gene_type:complete